MSFVFFAYLFCALQVAALIGGVVTRRWPIRPQQLVWRGTSVEHASAQIRSLLYDVDDVRFAYPTGQFVPVDAETDLPAGRVVMEETNFAGSKGLGVVFKLFAGAGVAARSAADGSLLAGFLVGWLGLCVAMLLAAPFLVASLIDVVYRQLYRSRITADVRRHAAIPDAVTVDLMFRGLSSFGIVGDVLHAAATPAPPAGSHAAAAVTEPTSASSRERAGQWAGAAERRSTMIYGSGVLVCVLLAAVLTIIAPLSGDGAGHANTSLASETFPENAGPSAEFPPGQEQDEPSPTTTTKDVRPPAGAYQSTTGGYAVVPPSGWIMNYSDKDKGSFAETKWHMRGRFDVYGLVDYTPGFAGTPYEGARDLRAAMQRLNDYNELDFSAVGDARRWEFTSDGLHKIDVFHKCGGIGVAVLAAAPTGDWADLEDELSTFVDSFQCTTGEDPGASDNEPGRGGDEGTTPSASSDAQTYPLTTKAGRMERAIRQHWKGRLEGDYAKAYNYYTGPVRARVGLESSWGEEVRRDGLNKVAFNDFDLDSVNGDRGRMRARIRTESDENGCQDWSFTYDMVHSGARWLIYDSKTDNASC